MSAGLKVGDRLVHRRAGPGAERGVIVRSVDDGRVLVEFADEDGVEFDITSMVGDYVPLL